MFHHDSDNIFICARNAAVFWGNCRVFRSIHVVPPGLMFRLIYGIHNGSNKAWLLINTCKYVFQQCFDVISFRGLKICSVLFYFLWFKWFFMCMWSLSVLLIDLNCHMWLVSCIELCRFLWVAIYYNLLWNEFGKYF